MEFLDPLTQLNLVPYLNTRRLNETPGVDVFRESLVPSHLETSGTPDAGFELPERDIISGNGLTATLGN